MFCGYPDVDMGRSSTISEEGTAVKLAAQAGETAITAGKEMQEYAGKALKEFDFGDFLDSVKNRLLHKQQAADPDSMSHAEFKGIMEWTGEQLDATGVKKVVFKYHFHYPYIKINW